MNWVSAVFSAVTGWLEASAWVAISAAFIWGACSVLLSPCHLSSIPLAIGYVNGGGRISPKDAFSLSLVFSVGILVTIGVVGAVTAAFGRMIGDVGALKYAVAAIFAVVGLWLMGLIPLPQVTVGGARFHGRGTAGAFSLGLLFGLALGPCSFGFMMPLLAVAFRNAASRPLISAGLLGAYGIGHVGVIVLAGTFANFVQGLLDWSARSAGTRVMRIACGVLVIAAGAMMVIS